MLTKGKYFVEMLFWEGYSVYGFRSLLVTFFSILAVGVFFRFGRGGLVWRVF